MVFKCGVWDSRINNGRGAVGVGNDSVMIYGDCGTSPRFGWINGSSAHDSLRWIVELCVLRDQCNGDCDE